MSVTGPSAIGRQQGKLDTDDNGLARYSLKIETPSGILSGNEPNLSLEYSQGTPNGVLGFSWCLGGISSITRSAPRVVYDHLNTPPAGYDSTKPKLVLDGVDLLNIDGNYFKANTVYSTEINNNGVRITTKGGDPSKGQDHGFRMVDHTGRRTDYGTTPNSRILSTTSATQAREWRIAKSTDIHGNTVVYNYIQSPQQATGAPSADSGTSYLDRIDYCGNSSTGVAASRYVQFSYAPRPDPIKQSVGGDVVTWAHYMRTISIGTYINGNTKVNRIYTLSYETSAITQDSALTTVAESSAAEISLGSNPAPPPVELPPTTFTYTSAQANPPTTRFYEVPDSPFSTISNVLTLVPLNLTGRALGDMACLSWDVNTKNLTINTYIAERSLPDASGLVHAQWSASPSPVVLTMPNLGAGQAPDVLTPDLNGDGRSDVIIPFSNAQNNLEFFLAPSDGEKLTRTTYSQLVTQFPWDATSKFMAMDMTGTGTIDVVQIYSKPGAQSTDPTTISFRNFPGIANHSDTVPPPFETDTLDAFENTIDWFLLQQAGTNAVSLVRVWKEYASDHQSYTFNATSYKCAKAGDSAAGFAKEGVKSVLTQQYTDTPGGPSWTVLTCDVNGDGSQDIVLAQATLVAPQITFQYLVSLGDGCGGFHQATVVDRALAPTALPAVQDGVLVGGQFSVTNLDGGLYPSLAYTYPDSSVANYWCLSVNGCSNGTVSKKIAQYQLNSNALSMTAPQAMPLDLTGSGMGDWLIYSLPDGTNIPSTLPVYNTAQPTDMLLTARDPMGLQTAVTYGTLSDTANVYDSGQDWRQYVAKAPDSYVLLGAPNYVVTALKHTNDPTINTLGTTISINKKYRQALINNVGRGWMGFESISTTNDTDKILTIEHYFQTFPKYGVKTAIETYTVEDTPVLLSKRTTDYEHVIRPESGPWHVWHVNKIFDQVETMGAKDVAGNIVGSRLQRTEFANDEHGNVTLKHSSETHGGTQVFNSWERCTYHPPIKGVSGLMAAKKLSKLDNPNADMANYTASEDLSFVRYTYDSQTALALKTEHWSDEANAFLATTYEYDGYGNETSSTDPLGLTTLTYYDANFHNLPITKVEKSGGKIMSRQRMAYDNATGAVVADLAANGRLSCTKVDAFGRPVETRMQHVGTDESVVSASQFFSGGDSYVTDKELGEALKATDPGKKILLAPFRSYSYNMVKSPLGQKPYNTKTMTSHFGHSPDQQSESLQLFDSVGQQCMQRSRQGSADTHVTWKSWKYDTRGNVLFESFPLTTVGLDNFEYQAGAEEGIASLFDQLGRVTSQTRPSHMDPSETIVASLGYERGGATVVETVKGPSPGASMADATLLVAPRTYISINGKEHVTEAHNGEGRISTFRYDARGNLVQADDPGKKQETRTYTSLGQLRTITNQYQSAPDPSDPPAKPLTSVSYAYDHTTGELSQTINAMGETITFMRDAKGRPLQKSASDGRVLVYDYAVGDVENLKSMTVYPHGVDDQNFESKVVFEYDGLGRVSSRTLSLGADADMTYKTTLTYDWQDQVVSKQYPNGAVKQNRYTGTLLTSTRIVGHAAGGSAEPPWLYGDFSYDQGCEKPATIVVGDDSMQKQFRHAMTYDVQGYTLNHTMSASDVMTASQNWSDLVQKQYVYNGADQLVEVSDGIEATTTAYKYDGKRLLSSKTGDVTNNYKYDESGNLTTKGHTTLSYTSNSVAGTDTQGSTVFSVGYDKAGRMTSRTTKEIPKTTFSYNSFGLVKSYTNTEDGSTTTLTSGPDGRTVRREADGGKSSLDIVSDDYSVQRLADGSTTVMLKLFGAGLLLAMHSSTSSPGAAAAGGDQGGGGGKAKVSSMSTAVASDHKGNITHRFRGSDAKILETITYDDFGTPLIGPASEKDAGARGTNNLPSTSTFEGRRLDPASGLLDFGSRYYDPLVGRFTSPDTILGVRALSRPDGLNRLAFENNDPINHVDPTGHFSWSAIGGALLGGLAVVGAAALTFATGGGAAVAAGALFSGGVAGIKYSFDHRNQRGGKFWAGYGATVAINAGIGALTGALGAVASSARIASATGRLSQAAGWSIGTKMETLFAKAATVGAKALVDATGSFLQTVASNEIENKFYGTHYGLFQGAGAAFASALALGLATGGLKAWKGNKGAGDDGSWVSILGVDGSESAYKAARGKLVSAATSVGSHIAQETHVLGRAGQFVGHEAQKHSKALTALVGSSGFVGSLQMELMKNQAFVSYG